MPQMNSNQVRVINPILSKHARGYRQAGLIGRGLFPIAFVAIYGGQVIEFGKESFRLYNSKRAPGANTKRIRFGYEGKPYSIQPSALEAPVPREHMRDATQVPGLNLATRATNIVLRSLNLEHEYACAQIAHNPANYGANNKMALVGDDRWTSPDSDPVGDIEDGKEAVRVSIGIRPNTLELSAKAYNALKKHPNLLARAADNNVRVVDVALLKIVFDIPNIIVGEATVADAADTLGDVWGDSAVLAYVAPEGSDDAGANAEEPSYGYTYAIEGHPAVEEPYYDNSAKSWIYGVSFDNTPVLSGMSAGFLFQNAGGAPA